MTAAALQRFVVVGISGSGKSTTARRIAQRLAIAHIELDAAYHQAGWRPAALDDMRAQVDAATAGPSWVVDGNYVSRVQDVVWPKAQVVVWLDLPRRVVMPALAWRTFSRGVMQTELWNGNREELGNLFRLDPNQNLLLFAWLHFSRYRTRYEQAAQAPEWAHLDFIRLRSRRSITAWLDTLPAP